MDGTALDVLHKEEVLDKTEFPDATQLQWKILKRKIALYKKNDQRLKEEEEYAR